MKFKAILGLGNPGEEFAKTYHNAGRQFVEFLAAQQGGVAFSRVRSLALARCDDTALAYSRVHYMNESGQAARELLMASQAKPAELLLVQDDTDIPFGEYRFSFGRGTAGHKGVASVLQTLGTKDFWRLRLGVRLTTTGHTKAGTYVLRPIPRAQRAKLERTFKAAAEQLDHWPQP